MLSLTICGTILVLIATVNANAGPKVTDQVRASGILFKKGSLETEKVIKLKKSSDICDEILRVFFVCLIL